MRRIALLSFALLMLCSGNSYAAMPEFVWAGGSIMASDQSRPGYMADTMVFFGTYNSVVFFADPMLTLKHEKLGVDIGGGGRFPVFSGEVIGGLIGYFDYNNDHNHRRFSIGAEAFHKYGECHINAYFPTSGLNDGQEALTGFDIIVGIPIPKYAFLTVWPEYYYFNGKHEDTLSGFGIKLQAQPIKPLQVYLGVRNNAPESGRNDGEVVAGIDITIPISGFDLNSMWKFYNPKYPIDIKTQMDSRVVRERFITYGNYDAQ
jgi:hypothetical protein